MLIYLAFQCSLVSSNGHHSNGIHTNSHHSNGIDPDEHDYTINLISLYLLSTAVSRYKYITQVTHQPRKCIIKSYDCLVFL